MPTLPLSRMPEHTSGRTGRSNSPPQVVRMTRSASQSRASFGRHSTIEMSRSRASMRRSTSDLGRVRSSSRRISRAETIEDIYDNEEVDWNKPEEVLVTDSDANSSSRSSTPVRAPRLKRTVSRPDIGRKELGGRGRSESQKRNMRMWSADMCAGRGEREKICGMLSKLNDSFDIDDTSSESEAAYEDEYCASIRTPDATPPDRGSLRTGSPVVHSPRKGVRVLSSDVNTWTVEDVAAWAGQAAHLGSEIEAFLLRHAVSGPVLLTLDEEVLTQLGMQTFGHRRQLMLSIKKLQDGDDPWSGHADRTQPANERAQCNPLVTDRTIVSQVGSSTVVSSNMDSSRVEYSGVDSSRMDSSRMDLGRSEGSTVDTRSKRLERMQSSPPKQRRELKASPQEEEHASRFYPATPQNDRTQGPRPTLAFPSHGLHSANVSPRTSGAYQMQSPTKLGQRRSPRGVAHTMPSAVSSARSNVSNFTSVSGRVVNAETQAQDACPPQQRQQQQQQEQQHQPVPNYSSNAPTGSSAEYRNSPRYSSQILAATQDRTSPRLHKPMEYRGSPRYTTAHTNPSEYRGSPRYTTAHTNPSEYRNSPRYGAGGLQSHYTTGAPPIVRTVKRTSTMITTPDSTQTLQDGLMRSSVEGMGECMRSLSQQMNNMAEQMKSMSQLPAVDPTSTTFCRTLSGGGPGVAVPGGAGGIAATTAPTSRMSFARLPQTQQQPLGSMKQLPSAGPSAVAHGRPNAQPVPACFSHGTNSPPRFTRPGATSPLGFPRQNSMISLSHTMGADSQKLWQHGG